MYILHGVLHPQAMSYKRSAKRSSPQHNFLEENYLSF